MTKYCQYRDCGKTTKRTNYCGYHSKKTNIDSFLKNLYSTMKRRVTTGTNTNTPHLYVGKPIMPKDVFISWGKNHPDFLALYKRWVSCDFDRKLVPTVNRMDSSKGYVLGNVEWMTNSQNCGLSGMVKKMNAQKEVYNLLGVNKDA